jgi:hypothetical protein
MKGRRRRKEQPEVCVESESGSGRNRPRECGVRQKANAYDDSYNDRGYRKRDRGQVELLEMDKNPKLPRRVPKKQKQQLDEPCVPGTTSGRALTDGVAVASNAKYVPPPLEEDLDEDLDEILGEMPDEPGLPICEDDRDRGSSMTEESGSASSSECEVKPPVNEELVQNEPLGEPLTDSPKDECRDTDMPNDIPDEAPQECPEISHSPMASSMDALDPPQHISRDSSAGASVESQSDKRLHRWTDEETSTLIGLMVKTGVERAEDLMKNPDAQPLLAMRSVVAVKKKFWDLKNAMHDREAGGKRKATYAGSYKI